MTVTVIDVSHYQAPLNLSTFAAQGGLAVIAKASQGASTVDLSFSSFRAQAAAVRLAFASYHYLSTQDAAQQAAFFLKTAKPVKGERVVADWEADGVDAAQVIAFLQAIQQARPDLQLTVYSGSSAKDELGQSQNAWLASNTSLWLAQYTTGRPSWPKGTWPQWSLWQYDDTNSLPGSNVIVDMNKFNGPDSQLLKWFGPQDAPAPPAPDPAIPTLTIALSADQPVNVRINGQLILVRPPAIA